MVADLMLIPARQRTRPVRTPRSPILLLEDVDGCDALPRYGDLIAAGSMHGVVRDRSEAPQGLLFPRSRYSTPAAWRRLQDEFDGSCIGLIAEPGSGVTEACRILEGGVVEGTGPGAIVLLGFGRDLVATCRRLACGSDAPGSSGTHGETASVAAAAALVEWPPMMIFLQEDDLSVGECAGACRAMRSLGIPIHLEVMRSMFGTEGGARAAEDLIGEIDRFFDEHLTPHVPRLL